MKLYHYPPSTYSQKAAIALYEKGVSFEPCLVNLADPDQRAAYLKIHPFGKVPMLVLDDGSRVPEATIIVEFLDRRFPSGPALIPEEPDQARKVRLKDRLGDLYVNDSIVTIIRDSFAPETEKEPRRVAKARATLDIAYAMLDGDVKESPWVCGEAFTMADCALAPPLLYAARLHPVNDHKNLAAYIDRLRQRPSVRRALEAAAPYLT
jgi:glutathione S-transferase